MTDRLSQTAGKPDVDTPRNPLFDLSILLLTAAAARIAWWIVADGATSVDLRIWHVVMSEMASGSNPYSSSVALHYPPFWMEVLYAAGKVAAWLHVNDVEVVPILLLGDLTLLGAIWSLLRLLAPARSHFRLLLWGYCLSPFLVILTIQHGNFDVFPILWVVLYLRNLIHFRRSKRDLDWLTAAAFLGLAIYTKTYPAILWPLLVQGARALPWRTRILGLALVAGPVTISLAPLYVIDPHAITTNVLAYRSIGYPFGLPAILRECVPQFDLARYAQISSIAMMIAALLAAVCLWKRELRVESDNVLVTAFTFLAVFTLGPGYASQYWFWVLPLSLICLRFARGTLATSIYFMIILANLSYVVHYGVSPALGGFLYRWSDSPSIAAWEDHLFGSNRRADLSLLPLIISALAVLYFGWAAVLNRYFRSPAVDSRQPASDPLSH